MFCTKPRALAVLPLKALVGFSRWERGHAFVKPRFKKGCFDKREFGVFVEDT